MNPGGFGGDKTPKGYNVGQLQQFDKRQMGIYNQLYSHVDPQSNLNRLAGGDQSLFDEIEAPAWRDFQQAQGQLANRFSQFAPGAMNAQGGSGFKNAAGQLGSDFAMQLQSNRQNLMRQALSDLMSFSNTLLGQRPTERALFEKPQHQMSTSSQFGLTALKTAGDVASAFAENY